MNIIRKAIILSLTLIFIHISALAQNLCNITGSVFDVSGTPIPFASAVIYSADKPLNGGITDQKGNFSIRMNRSVMEHKLIVEFIGYAKETVSFTPNKASVDIGRIILKEDAMTLSEAVVSAKADAVRSGVEHTVINADASMSSSKGSALDLLSTSSSVSVMNDEISIRGNKNILVLIDGLATTVSDLGAIPAANIKSIEVVTNPDSSHDSEGTGGIINIVTRKSGAKGFSGIIAANYGFKHFVTGNMAFSYVKPETSWRFSYNTKYEDDLIRSRLNRLVHEDNNSTNQQMEALKTVFNTNIGLGADFRIDKKNILGVDLRCILPRNNVRQDLHNSFMKDGIESQEKRHNDVTWNRENIEGVISYTHIIKPEVSDISIRGNISKIWGHRPSYYFLEGEQVNHSNSGGSPFISSLQADFKQKFMAGTLTAGAKLTYRQNDIYHKFYSWKDQRWEYSQTFSNDLMHTELIPAAYVLFTSKIGKRFTYKAGFRGEFSTVTLSSTHEDIKDRNNDFFASPSLSGTFRLNDRQDISLAFSRRIGRPAYPQLNPYMSMVDASTYEQGNMNLRPEKSSKADLSYNIKGRFVQLFADAYLNYTKDYISQITKMSESLLITTYINGLSDLKTGAEISLKVTPAKWMTATLNANTFHTDTKGRFEGAHIDNRGWSNNSNLLLDFIPGKTTDIQLQYFLTTPQYYPQLTTSLTHYMNIGVRQKFLKGAMSVSVLLTDALGTYRWEVRTKNAIFDLTNISTRKSRMLWLGLSYNFNSFKQKKTEKKADDDRSLIRLGI